MTLLIEIPREDKDIVFNDEQYARKDSYVSHENYERTATTNGIEHIKFKTKGNAFFSDEIESKPFRQFYRIGIMIEGIEIWELEEEVEFIIDTLN